MNNKTCAVILAGGEGKRMRSPLPKVLSEVLFKPMLQWVIDAVLDAGIEDICIVLGSRKNYIEKYLSIQPFKVETAYQAERLGTGHAVMMTMDFLKKHLDSKVLILNGDAPFVSSETIKEVLKTGENSVCTVLSAETDDPFGYGRIVRMDDGISLKAIVEEKEADEETRRIKEINSGVYCFDTKTLIDALGRLKKSPLTGEYYLTDTIELIQKSGEKVLVCRSSDYAAVLGANDGIQLSQLNEIARKRVLERHMKNGAVIPCTDGVIIGTDVEIGQNTVILPSTVLIGSCKIGSWCRIGPGVVLNDKTIPDATLIEPSYTMTERTDPDTDI